MQAIAAAAGRMPRATRVLFTGRSHYRERSPDFDANQFMHHTSASDIFDHRMMLSIGTSSWEPNIKSTELAVQVPLAIHAAGFPAVEVGVQCDPRSGISPHSTWIRDQAQLLGLKAAAESLKIFTFKTRMWPSRPSEDISSISTYLRVVLEAANLQVLTLSLSSDYVPGGQIESLLASRRWPYLRELNLAYIAFHMSDLKSFVEGLRPGVFLDFETVHLCSGTWAEGLDVLRSKANSESQVDDLRGAECAHISFHQRRRILDGEKASWASQYVQGVSIRNPFLVTEDETAEEETNAGTI